METNSESNSGAAVSSSDIVSLNDAAAKVSLLNIEQARKFMLGDRVRVKPSAKWCDELQNLCKKSVGFVNRAGICDEGCECSIVFDAMPDTGWPVPVNALTFLSRPPDAKEAGWQEIEQYARMIGVKANDEAHTRR